MDDGVDPDGFVRAADDIASVKPLAGRRDDHFIVYDNLDIRQIGLAPKDEGRGYNQSDVTVSAS